MIIMAEGDSGVILMSEATPKSHNGSAMTSDSDSESITTLTARSYLSAAETKRNKRKNFQPRNIAYSETESIGESFSFRDRSSSDSGESDYALDLSNADLIKSIKRGCSEPDVVKMETKEDMDDEDVDMSKLKVRVKDENHANNNDESDEPVESSSPIDLTCSKNTSPSPHNHLHATNSGFSDDTDCEDGDRTSNGGGKRCAKKRRKESSASDLPTKSPIAAPYALHSIVGHSVDVSDMKEYYQNTVKQFLEIYGLNNDAVTDVAQTIMNNVPVSNFSSGSLTIRKVSSVSPIPASKENSPTPASKENRPQSISTSLQPSVSTHPVDYSRYVKRYSTAVECGSSYCKNLNYREHFHCLGCNSRVFIKKEEMIRHFKWHKKRDESLQHGFMRYSPSDDCSDRFPNCSHNRKQTHYHCIQNVAQGSCDKVYISTSDVQMHANYHRKDSAIIQEGFQRLRATEECRTSYCTFFGQRTTHFHCRREHCQYTFKNKADMEKHKTYHIKDEQLAKDGFKKFLKPDPCGFASCRFSQVCNHIHCVREGCSYVLHSSGQLLSHKRKHERKDSEIAYRKFKLTQQNLGAFNGTEQLFQQSQLNSAMNSAYSVMQDNNFSNSSSEGPSSPANSSKYRSNSIQLTGGFFRENLNAMDFSQSEDLPDHWYRYISQYLANDVCPPNSKCLMHGSDHYHCRETNCDLSFKTKEVAESHARQHEAEERLSEVYQDHCQDESCAREKHYHCTMDNCEELVLPNERLDHLRTHEISTSQMNSLDALFRRKRGRPPKNRVIEVWNDYSGLSGNDSPQAIFTSFKLPKPSSGGAFANSSHHSDNELSSPPSGRVDSPKQIPQHILDQYKFEAYTDDCPDVLCMYSANPAAAGSHYHCKRPRCYFATNAETEEPLIAHSEDFHENVVIMDDFLFFDASVHCRRENCRSNKINRHFHCVRPGCEFSFEHYPMMIEHNKKHQLTENVTKNFKAEMDVDIKREPHSPSSNTSVNAATNITPTSIIASPDTANSKSSNVVKASGTFYPLCGLTNTRSSSPTCNNDEKPKFESPAQSEPLALGPSTNVPSLLNLLPDDWSQANAQVKFTTEKPCSRPFCKLKRKDHYHCHMCNQAFSELDKLKHHIIKHNTSSMSPFVKAENNNNSITEDSEDVKRSPVIPTTLPLGLESPYQAAGFGAAMAAAQQFAMMTSQGISFIPHGMAGLYTSQPGLMFAPPHAFPHPHPLIANGLLDALPTHPASLPIDSSGNDLTAKRSLSPSHDLSPEMKKARIQTSMRILKDEPVPDGYLRFRFNEDCHYQHCGYREHQTHFHCVRQDCGYSFCDKTRFVQHTARHERLDTLMGGDFQQYRANVSCGRRDCVYTASLGSSQNKASHFHCLKCEFVCTDTNKVVAHRRQHQKLDSINAAGFEKYTPAQACSQPDTCVHSGKQTHYHCLSCQYAVLGLSQMTAHKYRHLES